MHVKFRFSALTALDGSRIDEKRLMKKIEHAQMLRQITNFASFLPNEVLEMPEYHLTHSYVAVILFIEMIGLIELAEKYNKVGTGGMYKLTATINAYVSGIIESLHYYGGDVLRFSAHTIITQWKVLPHESLMEILHEIVCCALFLQKTFGNFETEANIHIHLRVVITCGNLTFFIVGDATKKSFDIAGEIMHELGLALEATDEGEVVVTSGTWAYMLDDRYLKIDCGDFVKVFAVVYKANEAVLQINQDDKQAGLLVLIERHLMLRRQLHTTKKFESYHTDTTTRSALLRSLPQRRLVKFAPKNWKVDELRVFVVKPVHEQIDESQPVEYLTQMHEVSIQIVSILPTVSDSAYTELINEVFNIICQEIGKSGIIINIGLIHKWFVIETVFGLKGQTEGTEYQSALKSGYKARKRLKCLYGIKEVSVAVINCCVYTGVIGHPLRKTFALIGTGLRIAKKMANKFVEKITCDYITFKNSKLSSFYFTVKSYNKKYDDFGRIFVYDENYEPRTDATSSNRLIILGRAPEFNAIRSIIFEPEKVGYYGICFFGPSKIGKSAVLEHITSTYSSDVVSIAAIELEGSSHIPYYCVSKIYRQLYDLLAKTNSAHLYYILCLPNELLDVRSEIQHTTEEDIAMQKYRILNYFRDIVQLPNHLTIICVDNVDQIDLQSLEILEIVLGSECVRLILTGNFDFQETWDLRFRLSLNAQIKLVELQPIHEKCIATLACLFLEVAAIPKKLTTLLIKCCEGRPGYLQTCLLRLVNTGSIELKLVNIKDMDCANFLYPVSKHLTSIEAKIIPVITYSERYKDSSLELTMDVISMDLFDSYTPYEQLVIKTGAVLGNLFTRMLLIVALKYPTELTLAKVIHRLFNEEVIECGARFQYADNIESNAHCCQCYFEEDFFDASNERFLPKYSYCKILHFKNTKLRDVAYSILPINQRKELHLLCTDILENLNNKCPSCLRAAYTNVFDIGKFKDIMQYCNNINEVYEQYNNNCDGNDLRLCIREIIKNNNSLENVNDRTYKKISEYHRYTMDEKYCSCYEIFLRVYKDLIYHSECAGHLAKRIFFTMQYGYLLINLMDLSTAISFLTKARELCLIDSYKEEAGVSDTFRKLNVGRIEIGLAKAAIEMRQLKTAKSHLAIALRQYNIPSLALSYKFFKQFITRNYLINKSNFLKPTPYKDVIARYDMGLCLSLCSKLFHLEGNEKMSKLTAAYSIYLIKSANPNVDVLLEVYCNAIDIHQYFTDKHECHVLVRNLGKEVIIRYCNHNLFNVYYLGTLLNSLFVHLKASGNIYKAIRFAYRYIDISRTFFSAHRNFSVMANLVLLLLYTFRIEESVAVCQSIKNCRLNMTKSKLLYYTSVLVIYIRTGFSAQPINLICMYAKEYLIFKPPKMGWEDLYFTALVQLHYIKLKNFSTAEEYRYFGSFNENLIRREVVLKTLLITIECKIYLYLFDRKHGYSRIDHDKKAINKLLKLMKTGVKTFKLSEPIAICLCAWWCMVMKKQGKAFRLLKSASKIAKSQGNVLLECYVHQLKSSWKGGSSPRYGEIVNDYKNAHLLSLKEWAQILSPLPLVM